MSRKLFVGGLPWATTDEGLRKAFEEFGEIEEANVVRERDTGRSRGFGFVTFDSEEGAKAAQEGMHGQEIDGRPVRVDFAHSKARQGRNDF
ncbi:MAG: RNA-binding protein [Candidatus Aegiribacteria sp.]|jgi:RNA recognition motif-containing protein|nr:RNA-binding protein [Candidatus Aegiribacteria sp.]